MAICETVKIDDGSGGSMVINKSDFDAKKHKLFSEKKAAPKTEKPKAPVKKAAK